MNLYNSSHQRIFGHNQIISRKDNQEKKEKIIQKIKSYQGVTYRVNAC